jgi:hypothetical protein
LFKYFHWSHKPKVNDLKIYNIHLKFALFLKNVKTASSFLPIKSFNHHQEWIFEDFNFEVKNDINDQQLTDHIKEERKNIREKS